MSLANTCDRCKKVITGPAVTDKEDFDVAVIVDGEPYYVCEDMCPECRRYFVSLVDGFKRIESPATQDVRKPEPAEPHEPAPVEPEIAVNMKREPDEPAPDTEYDPNARAPYRSLDEDELPNAVTKRFPLPHPITPTQDTSR